MATPRFYDPWSTPRDELVYDRGILLTFDPRGLSAFAPARVRRTTLRALLAATGHSASRQTEILDSLYPPRPAIPPVEPPARRAPHRKRHRPRHAPQRSMSLPALPPPEKVEGSASNAQSMPPRSLNPRF